jgi:hypothetical protein
VYRFLTRILGGLARFLLQNHAPTTPTAHSPTLPRTLPLQMTLYVPGPVLREGDNEVILLEVERVAREDAGAWPVQAWLLVMSGCGACVLGWLANMLQ